MDTGPGIQRVIIELRRGEGPMTGRFLAEGRRGPASFDGWLELLALLEAARTPAAETPEGGMS